MTTRPRRSALYMPASNSRAIEKGRTLPCDVIILDLEDAVAPEAKAVARQQAIDAVRDGGFGRREVVVRVNGLDTPWGADDVDAIATVRPDAVLLPKVSSAATLRDFRSRCGDTPFWGMIETCRAIANLTEIADAARANGLTVMVAGTNDLAKELRCQVDPSRSQLLPALSQILVAARVAGAVPLDGVCNTIGDEPIIETECRQALAWGFEGKTLIHPSQIGPANRTFRPTLEEIEWARRIRDVFNEPGNAGKGVVRIDGTMVELLHLEQACRMLALADAVDANETAQVALQDADRIG